MRKFLITLTTIALAMSLILSGCSCNKKSPLSFTNDFSGGGGSTNDVSVGYSETLVYDVTYIDKFTENNAHISKDSLLDSLVTFSFSDGTYTSIFTVESAYDANLPKSNILAANGGTYDKEIYHLKTELKINVNYAFKNGGENKSFEDIVTSEVYFANYGSSFAPIYAKTDATYSILYIDENQAASDSVKYSYETIYNAETYMVTKTAYNEKGEAAQVDKDEYEYTYKTVVDNTELLFVARNIKIAKEGSYSIPTVAPQYGEAKTLTLKNLDEITVKTNFNYNGTDVNEDMKVKCLSFAVDSQKTSGTSQYIKVQNGASASVSQKALLVEYVESLVSYGTTSCMGALKYTLKTASIG